MTRDEAKEYINQQEPSFLTKAAKRGYICPECGQGANKGQGITRATGRKNLWHCVDCKRERSIIGLFAIHSGIPDDSDHFIQALEAAADFYGVTIDQAQQKRTQKPVNQSQISHADEEKKIQPRNYTAYYDECRRALTKSQTGLSYLSARGISKETAVRFGIGYDDRPEPRIIVPVTEDFYFARAINPNSQYSKMNCKDGNAAVSNIGILNSARCVFVCESWGSGLSIAEAGCAVLWTNSTENVGLLITYLKENRTDAVLCLAFDNDKAGRNASAELEAALQELHIRYLNVTADICPVDGSDPNDALVMNRESFFLSVKAAEQKALYPSLQAFDDFLTKIQTESFRPVKTGMQSLDNLLGGGMMRQGLIILMAAPGAGKTCFAQQVFEGMAKGGTDVIFLNLEMSRDQLYARGLSRIIWKNRRKMSAANIMRGYEWTDPQREFVQEAADEYRRTIAPHMAYNPEGCTTTLESIMGMLNAAGERAMRQGKPAPVVVLDYLHLVTAEKRMEQSEIIKQTLAALKGWAIRYDSFVFAISASNRTSNSNGIQSLESGRDTSALEYTADTTLGLNYTAFVTKKQKPNGKTYSASDPDDMEELMKGNANGEREMTVQVLKNRMTAPGGKLNMLFNPAASTFTPIEESKTAPATGTKEGFVPFQEWKNRAKNGEQ